MKIGFLFKTELNSYQERIITQKLKIVIVSWHLKPLVMFEDMTYWDNGKFISEEI